jgi:hypothetical protein
MSGLAMDTRLMVSADSTMTDFQTVTMSFCVSIVLAFTRGGPDARPAVASTNRSSAARHKGMTVLFRFRSRLLMADYSPFLKFDSVTLFPRIISTVKLAGAGALFTLMGLRLSVGCGADWAAKRAGTVVPLVWALSVSE